MTTKLQVDLFISSVLLFRSFFFSFFLDGELQENRATVVCIKMQTVLRSYLRIFERIPIDFIEIVIGDEKCTFMK